MKTVTLLTLTLLLTTTIALTPTTAQEHQRLGLPEGATRRLGKGRINEIAYSPNGTLLAVASSIGIWLYDTATYHEVALLTGHTGGVESVAFSLDGTPVDLGIRQLNLPVESVAFSPDSTTLAGASFDGSIRLWDVATGDTRQTLTGHTSNVTSVAFSPDGQTLASGSWQNIRLWDIATGYTLTTLTGHPEGIKSVVFSPDGQTLASGGLDDTIRLWDVATGDTRQTLTGHKGWVRSVAFSPDGQTLASGSRQNIRLWDIATGYIRHLFIVDTYNVSSVVFSPDGQTLASGSGDGSIRLWDVATGDTRQTLTGHTDGVFSVVFSPNGKTLASGSYDGTVLLWSLAPLAATSEPVAEDINGDGVVNIQDLTLVAAQFGQTGEDIAADVNGDGVVDIQDLVLVTAAFGEAAAAPAIATGDIKTGHLPATDVQQWLRDAKQANAKPAGIAALERLLAALTRVEAPPKETVLLANYPNPFNPETWIPYELAEPAEVTLSIYAADGKLVCTLALGQLPAGTYQSRSRAAYWDGRNAQGEPVASGIYFYTLQAGEFTATRKMLIRK